MSRHKVKVYGQSINCPCCSAKIRLIQHKGKGAAYAKKWQSLSLNHVEFLKLWLDSDFKDSWINKNTLFKKLLPQMKKDKLRGFIGRVPFNGRVSELVSAGIDYNSSLLEKIPSVKTGNNGDIIRGPFYKLRISRVRHVLRHGGILT